MLVLVLFLFNLCALPGTRGEDYEMHLLNAPDGNAGRTERPKKKKKNGEAIYFNFQTSVYRKDFSFSEAAFLYEVTVPS